MSDFTIDRENKTFVFNDGEVLPIPKDKQKQVLRSKAAEKSKQEAIEKWQEFGGKVPLGETGHALINSASENLFGNLGDTLANYAVSGIKSFSTGEGQEGMSYRQRLLDHFYAMQEGRKEHLAGQQAQSPVASGIGKGLGIAGELGTLYGVPGALALPIMGAGSSETSFLEPEEKSKEVVKDTIEGFLLDKFFGSLGKIAGNRGTQRELRDLIANTERSNAAEISRVGALNEAEQLKFAQQNAAREAELAGLPALQQAENEAFLAANENSANRIARTMGKENLSNEILGVEDFISEAIDTSVHAASNEGSKASKFLRSVFKGDKKGRITGDSLQKGIRALDEAILKNEGTVKEILVDYKNFLNKNLPERLAGNYVSEKWGTKLLGGTEKINNNLSKIFNSEKEVMKGLDLGLGPRYLEEFNAEINNVLKDKIKAGILNTTPEVLKEELAATIKSSPVYQNLERRVNSMFAGQPDSVIKVISPGFENVKMSLEKYPELLAERVAKNYTKYQPDIGLEFSTKGGVTRNALEKAPLTPNMVPQPPPIAPIQPISPNLAEVPIMPEPQGIYGRLASGLEGMRNMGPKELIGNAQGAAPTALLAKLAGLPVAKAGLGAAGLATGLRGLTSPSATGNFLRGALGQGARTNVEKIDALAQKYPSYQNGVVELPQHRRSLTKEIENIPDLSLEEKAIFQSKVNRGKPLTEKL